MSVFVIVELGLNHNGSEDVCKKMINEAFSCGADAVKFQVISAEAGYNLPSGNPLKDVIGRCDLGNDALARLSDYAKNLGLTVGASAADVPAINVCRNLQVDFLKISSSNFMNRQLHDAVAGVFQQVVASTGSVKLNDIISTVEYFRLAGVQMKLMHCISKYPAPIEECHLDVIPFLSNLAGMQVGFSDHTPSLIIGAVAVAKGAALIEKHLTLDKAMQGPDHQASLLPEEMKRYIKNIREAEKATGNSRQYYDNILANQNLQIKRSLVAKKAMQAGEYVHEDDILTARPADYPDDALPLDWYRRLKGVRLQKPIEEWHTFTWAHVVQE